MSSRLLVLLTFYKNGSINILLIPKWIENLKSTLFATILGFHSLIFMFLLSKLTLITSYQYCVRRCFCATKFSWWKFCFCFSYSFSWASLWSRNYELKSFVFMLPLSLVSPSVIVEDLTRMMMSYNHHKLKASLPFIKGCCKLVYV